MQYLPAPRTIKDTILGNRTWLLLTIVVAIFAFFAFFRVVTAPKAGAVAGPDARTVSVASVASLSQSSAPLHAVGIVTSVNHAELHTKKGGAVTAAYAKAGAYVSAGETLATLENAAESAALASAKARINSAQAALDKIQKGTRDEQLAILSASVKSAEDAAKSALTSAFGAADSATLHGTDTFLTDPRGINPQYSLPTSDYAVAVKVGSGRMALQSILAKYEKLEQSPITADLAVMNATNNELTQIRSYLDDVLSALNKTLPSTNLTTATIAGYTAQAQGARAAVIGAQSALSGATAALEIAKKNQEQGVNGAQAEDVAAVKAQLEDAQAGYAAALAQYNNTLVMSPISGTLASFSLRSGDFVSPNEMVGAVENPQALEIIAYIAPSDRARAVVGEMALVNDQYEGVVTSVAPGVDQARGGIEMHVALTDTASETELANGSTVSISVSQDTDTAATKKTIAIPVAAIKLTSEGAFVFTVSSTTLVAHKITVGEIVGQDIVITKGVTPQMAIVTDARGLSEGDVVSVTK